tara:strand:+ start:447 stop:2615 length:2169 start_codon:yes stop_codon:yes gene_type:complete
MNQFPANQPMNPMMFDITPDMGISEQDDMSMGEYFANANRAYGLSNHPLRGLPTNSADAEAQTRANDAVFKRMSEANNTPVINDQIGLAEHFARSASQEEASVIAGKNAVMQALRDSVARNNGRVNEANKEFIESDGMIPEVFAQLVKAGEFHNRSKTMQLLTGNLVADIISQQNLDDLSTSFGRQYQQGTRTGAIAKGVEGTLEGLPPNPAQNPWNFVTPVYLYNAASWLFGGSDDSTSIHRDGDMNTASAATNNRMMEEAYKLRPGFDTFRDYASTLLNSLHVTNNQTKALPNEEVFGPGGVITDELQGVTVYLEQLREVTDKDVHKKVAEKMMSETGWSGGADRQKRVLELVDKYQKAIVSSFSDSDQLRELMKDSISAFDRLEKKYNKGQRSQARDLFIEYYKPFLGGSSPEAFAYGQEKSKNAQSEKDKIRKMLESDSDSSDPQKVEDFNFAMQILSRVNGHLGGGMAGNFNKMGASSKYNNIDEYRKYINDENLDPADILKEMKAVRKQYKSAATLALRFKEVNDTLIGDYSTDMDEYKHFMTALSDTIKPFASEAMMSNPQAAIEEMAKTRQRLVESAAENGSIAKYFNDIGISFGDPETLEAIDLVAPSREALYDYYYEMQSLAESTDEGESVFLPEAEAPWQPYMQRMALLNVYKARMERMAFEGLPVSEDSAEQLKLMEDLQDQIDINELQDILLEVGPEGLLEELGGEVED